MGVERFSELKCMLIDCKAYSVAYLDNEWGEGSLNLVENTTKGYVSFEFQEVWMDSIPNKV